jgi:aspartate/methionine/tyrosine aminotransferase
VIEAVERVQQCSILCPDTLEQMTMARYLKRAIPDGSLQRYVDFVNALYRKAAHVTIDAVDRHLRRPRLVPAGGLYTVVDVGRDAETFVPEALKATGVLVVPGRGFGPSLGHGVRISFGPMVNDLEKIDAGLERLGHFMNRVHC